MKDQMSVPESNAAQPEMKAAMSVPMMATAQACAPLSFVVGGSIQLNTIAISVANRTTARKSMFSNSVKSNFSPPLEYMPRNKMTVMYHNTNGRSMRIIA